MHHTYIRSELAFNMLINTSLISRRSRQRERLHAAGVSLCSSVRLSVAKMQKTRFSQKLSNLVSCNWAFQRTNYWIPKIQNG